MNRFENLLFRYFEYLDAKGKVYNAVVGLIWTIAISALDFLSPEEVKPSFLYILPIAFVSWFSGLRLGLVASLLCTAIWSIHNAVESLLISSWNILLALVFFTAIAVIMNKTRQLWENEKQLSRTDHLTGAKNLRAFSELVEHEILRSQRDNLPFSLAYLDLDNFKTVNDTKGHTVGDELLTSMVACLVCNLRKTDVVGRMGGDEFAIFFPETDQAAVRVVMHKVRDELTWLMENAQWPTTFSIGVITCSGGVYDFNKLIHHADALMYEVKLAGKNNIRYSLYPSLTP